MKVRKEEINCSDNDKPFTVVKISFEYEKDKKIVNKLIKKGEELSKKVNPVLARDSKNNRENTQILSNSIAGIISEFAWRIFLKIKLKNKNIEVNETELTDIKNQIDLEIKYASGNKKTCEVRSSFPYTGIENGVCKVFDIIGWYSNIVKKKEVKKDYYLRALFPYKENEFQKKIYHEFEIYLVGGSTKELLEKSPNAKDKVFEPFYESNQTNTKYRVISPIKNGLDIEELVKIISKEN